MNMRTDKMFKGFWENLRPLMTDACKLVGQEKLEMIRFRGHNPKSPNKVEAGKVKLWLNLTSGRASDRHQAILLAIWNKLRKIYGDALEHVQIAPANGPLFTAGIYLDAVDTTEDDPYLESYYLS